MHCKMQPEQSVPLKCVVHYAYEACQPPLQSSMRVKTGDGIRLLLLVGLNSLFDSSASLRSLRQMAVIMS